jgi:hypothetical protein
MSDNNNDSISDADSYNESDEESDEDSYGTDIEDLGVSELLSENFEMDES